MSASPIQRSQLRLARAIIDRTVRDAPLPDVSDLPRTLIDAGAALRGREDMRPSSRTFSVQAVAFAATYMWDFLPLTWTYAADELRSATQQLTTSALANSQQAFHPLDPRLAWRTDDGQLVIDELHATHLNDGLIDTWMRRRLTAGIGLAHHIAGEKFAGVRLLSMRYPSRSLWTARIDDDPIPLRSADLGVEGGLRR